MQFLASHKHAPMSARKARLVMDLIRGKRVEDALRILRATPKRASYHIDKVLRSAIANADQSLEADMESLIIQEATVNEGPTRKKWRACARGRTATIRRRTCHLAIKLDDLAI